MALRLLSHIELPAHRSNGGFDHADIHPPTDRLYVAHTSNDSIDVIDCARDQYIESIPGLTAVAGALVSETRDLVFTSNRGENTVSVFAPCDEQRKLHGGGNIGSGTERPIHAKMPFSCRVMRFAPHPRRRGEIFAVLEVSGVMRSTDGGESWSDCSADLLRLAEAEPRLRSKLVSDTEAEGMLDGHAVCTSSADPDSIIIAVRMGLFRSKDQGKSWQDMRVDRFSPFTYGRDIKVSPQDPNTLYACLSVAASSKDGALYPARTSARLGSASTG